MFIPRLVVAKNEIQSVCVWFHGVHLTPCVQGVFGGLEKRRGRRVFAQGLAGRDWNQEAERRGRESYTLIFVIDSAHECCYCVNT